MCVLISTLVCSSCLSLRRLSQSTIQFLCSSCVRRLPGFYSGWSFFLFFLSSSLFVQHSPRHVCWTCFKLGLFTFPLGLRRCFQCFFPSIPSFTSLAIDQISLISVHLAVLVVIVSRILVCVRISLILRQLLALIFCLFNLGIPSWDVSALL